MKSLRALLGGCWRRLAPIRGLVACAVAYPGFVRDYRRFKARAAADPRDWDVSWSSRLPMLADRTRQTFYDRHYVLHPAWAMRVLMNTRPAEHVDIASTLHFCTLASAVLPVRFYDYRPAQLQVSGLTSEAADLTALPFADRSIHSLSCMHVVEHVGLGRYGDPMDPLGDTRAMAELTRVLAPGGSLLFVVPVGRPRICFNAHRVYSFEQVIAGFKDLHLREFTLIPDAHGAVCYIPGASAQRVAQEEYGCGCFWFQRTR